MKKCIGKTAGNAKARIVVFSAFSTANVSRLASNAEKSASA